MVFGKNNKGAWKDMTPCIEVKMLIKTDEGDMNVNFYTTVEFPYSLNPNDFDYFFRRGVTKYCLKQYGDAIKDIYKAIELNPEESEDLLQQLDSWLGNNDSLSIMQYARDLYSNELFFKSKKFNAQYRSNL